MSKDNYVTTPSFPLN